MYRYEDSQLICYSIINGNVQQRAVLNKADQTAMNDSKAYMIGVPGLLPDYLQDLSVTQTDDAAVFTADGKLYSFGSNDSLYHFLCNGRYYRNYFIFYGGRYDYKTDSETGKEC